jgi:malonate decarboxylase epsilon subunit
MHLLRIDNVSGHVLRSAKAILEDLADNIAHGVRSFDATSVLEELGCDLLHRDASGPRPYRFSDE